MPSKITDPKKQLELLTIHQSEFEVLLHALTGLTVKVSLTVHSADNLTANLPQLFKAGIASTDFEQRSTFDRTWISHIDLNRTISVFMPKDFDADELYPEPEDDEGYNLAVEVSNATKQEISSEELEDTNPF